MTYVVRAVLFDIGGVLETETAMPVHLYEAFDGRDPEDLLTIGLRSEEWIRTALRTEVGLPERVVEQYMTDLWDWYCGSLDERMLGWAESLRDRYRVAILSNSADGARREEESRYGFSTVFEPIIYSHEVGLAKPDARIYALTCELLGCAPEEVVFIDNLIENVEAAAAYGMRAVHHVETELTIATVEALLRPRVQP
jgi:epoxide hydrolase-like predicted phosphatase